MASPETRQINAINTAWASGSGAVTDIDEPIGSPDTAYYSGGVEDEAAEFGFTASEVEDGFTVTNITLNMIYRDDGSAGTVSVQVDLLISGSPVGAGSSFSVSGSDTEYNVNIAAWNTDFTAAEMDAAELRITPTQSGMPGTQLPFLETANMVVTFTSATFDPDFDAFRFYEDGTESGSTPIAAQDTDVAVDVTGGDVQAHLRTRIQETGGAAGAATDDSGLEYSKNSGGWTAITASSSDVKADTASGLTADAATTNRGTNGISDGTGSFVAGEQEETNGVIENHQLTASNFTEHVWALTLVSADLADGDTIDFRIALNCGAPGMTNTSVPRITIGKAVLQNGADFDGTADWIDASTPASADATEWSIVSFFKPTGASVAEDDRWFQASGGRAVLGTTLTSAKSGTKYRLRVRLLNAALGVILDVETDYAFEEDVWNVVFVSYDSVAQTVHIWNHDTEVEDAAYGTRFLLTGTINIAVEHSVGAAVNGNNKFTGGLGPLWMTNEFIDFSSSTNRDKFLGGDNKPNMVGIGADGSLPTGTQPIYWLREAYGTFEVNAGSAGDFTVNGALADEGTLPEIPSTGAGAPVFMHHFKQMANN